jgi:hypothetical protein
MFLHQGGFPNVATVWGVDMITPIPVLRVQLELKLSLEKWFGIERKFVKYVLRVVLVKNRPKSNKHLTQIE